MQHNVDYLINELHDISIEFEQSRGISDIFTNSKIYEVVIAEQLNHNIINGHAYTSDATDSKGAIYEYKHFKLSSTNHTWTFNDFSTATIEHLKQIDYVIFAIIDDSKIIPIMTEFYRVPANIVSEYLALHTPFIKNARSMINISPHSVETKMYVSPIHVNNFSNSDLLRRTFNVANKLSSATGVDNILTSNKLWEVLVSVKLGHSVNPDQKKHDAVDAYGHTYEYKVSSRKIWAFQDISQRVLDNYLDDTAIILAIVDKRSFSVVNIYACSPKAIVSLLNKKLDFANAHNAHLRRRFAIIGVGNLKYLLSIGAAEIIV